MRTRIGPYVVLVTMLVARGASGGPYMTGIGVGSLNLFPNGLFPQFSGPVMLGGAYAQGLGGKRESGAVLRFGLAMIKFHETSSLARPVGMLALDGSYHFGADPHATLGLSYQTGLGPILVGGGLAIGLRDREMTSHRGLVVSPEVSLPLRWKAAPRFTPSAVLFVKLDLAASARDVFDDQLVTGVSLLLW